MKDAPITFPLQRMMISVISTIACDEQSRVSERREAWQNMFGETGP
jgi:hypothetical protein